MFTAHLILSANVHSQKLPHDPLRGRLENITPIPISIIKKTINIIDVMIVIIVL